MKPKLKAVNLSVFDQIFLTEALNCIAPGTGALPEIDMMIGRQCRGSWEAIASANPFLEEVRFGLVLAEPEMDFSVNGHRTGELRTFHWGFGDQDRRRLDEFFSMSLSARGHLPHNLQFDQDNDGFSLQRYRYDESSIVYFGYKRVVTEQEVLDILEPFFVCPVLRVLKVSDVDERTSPESVKATYSSTTLQNACVPLRHRRRFAPYVRLMGMNYV